MCLDIVNRVNCVDLYLLIDLKVHHTFITVRTGATVPHHIREVASHFFQERRFECSKPH